MTIVGADVGELRALGKLFDDTANKFERMGTDLTTQLSRSACGRVRTPPASVPTGTPATAPG